MSEHVPAVRKKTLPSVLTLQTDGVDDVTDVAPLLLVDTVGENDPPMNADEGRLAMVGMGALAAPASGGWRVWTPTAITKPLTAVATASRIRPRRPRRSCERVVTVFTSSL
jgi:hypothetical protein